MSTRQKLIIFLVVGILLCSVVGIQAATVTYKLTDIDKHLMHVEIIRTEKLEPNKVTVVPLVFSSAEKVTNVKAFDLTEDTELRAEVAKIKGRPGIKVYVSPIMYPGREWEYEYGITPFEKKKVVNVKLKIEADIKDDTSFYKEGKEVVFERIIGGNYEEITVLLPSNCGIVYSNYPIVINQKGISHEVVEAKIDIPEKEKFRVLIKAKHVLDGLEGVKLKKEGNQAEEDFLVAQRLYKDGVFDLAAEQFRNFIEEYPESELQGDAQYWMGMSFWQTGS